MRRWGQTAVMRWSWLHSVLCTGAWRLTSLSHLLPVPYFFLSTFISTISNISDPLPNHCLIYILIAPNSDDNTRCIMATETQVAVDGDAREFRHLFVE